MLEPLIDPGDGGGGGAGLFGDLPVWMTLIEQPDHRPAMGEVGQLSKSAKVPKERGRLVLGSQGQDGFKEGRGVLVLPFGRLSSYVSMC